MMEIKQRLNHLTIKLIFVYALCLSFSSANAQHWKKLDSLQVPFKIVSYAIDQDGKIYLGSSEGDIYRYDENLLEDKLFSGINFSEVTIIEPWNRLKLFLFYRENQLIIYMDRFITSPTEYSLSDLDVGFGSLATPGVDDSFWVLESNFNELRKFREKELIFSTPLKNINTQEASHLRAYQNLLILLDRNFGFYFFDQFGNSVSELPLKGCSYFHIADKKVITYDGRQVIQFNAYKHSDIQLTPAPDGNYIGVLKSKQFYYFIESQSVLKYFLN